MNIEDYPSNSHRSRETAKSTSAVPTEKKVAKVVTGNVKTKKKSEFRKLADTFIAEDVANVKSYLVHDVLIPTFKNTIWDAFTNSLEMVLFGEVRRNKSHSGSSSSYVSYSSYSDRNRRDTRHRDDDRNRNRFDFDEIVLDSKGDAEAVLDQMEDILDRYNVVTVADLYDMLGRSAPYTSQKYGWTNLRNAEAVRVRGGGYVLKLPRALPID